MSGCQLHTTSAATATTVTEAATTTTVTEAATATTVTTATATTTEYGGHLEGCRGFERKGIEFAEMCSAKKVGFEVRVAGFQS